MVAWTVVWRSVKMSLRDTQWQLSGMWETDRIELGVLWAFPHPPRKLRILKVGLGANRS